MGCIWPIFSIANHTKQAITSSLDCLLYYNMASKTGQGFLAGGNLTRWTTMGAFWVLRRKQPTVDKCPGLKSGASATDERWTIMWFSKSKAQINMAVLPLFIKVYLYNVEIKMAASPISHSNQLKPCVYIVQSICEKEHQKSHSFVYINCIHELRKSWILFQSCLWSHSHG